MKKLSRLLGVACFGVLFLPLLFGQAREKSAPLPAGVSGQDKKAAEKVSPAEIEKLLSDLAGEKFTTRELASKRLRETPGALSHLRRHLKMPSLVLEQRRRVEQLVAEISRATLKRRLEELATKKSDAPLDLVVDLLLENRPRARFTVLRRAGFAIWTTKTPIMS